MTVDPLSEASGWLRQELNHLVPGLQADQMSAGRSAAVERGLKVEFNIGQRGSNEG